MKKLLILFLVCFSFGLAHCSKAEIIGTNFKISSELLNNSTSASANSYTYGITVPANYTTNALVCLADLAARGVMTGLTYNGTAMTLFAMPSPQGYVYHYYLLNAATGTHNLVMSFSGTAYKDWRIECYAVNNVLSVASTRNDGAGNPHSSPNYNTWQDTSVANKPNSLVLFFGEDYQYSGTISVSGSAATTTLIAPNYYWYTGVGWSYYEGIKSNNNIQYNSFSNFGMTGQVLEFNLIPAVGISNPANGSTVYYYDTQSVLVQGNCYKDGINQLAIESSYALPIPQPTVDCIGGQFGFIRDFGTFGNNKSICLVDKDDNTKYGCSTFNLYPNATYPTATPTSTPFISVSKYDSSLGSFNLFGSDNFDYYSGQSWGGYSTSTLPFEVFTTGVSLTSTSTKLQIYEVNSSSTPFSIINTLQDSLLNNIAFNGPLQGQVYTADLTATSTRFYYIRMVDLSGNIWDSKLFTLNLYSSQNNLSTPASTADKLFAKTKAVLRTKLLFAQFFAFYDNLLAAVNATTSTPLTFTMKFPAGAMTSGGVGSTTSATVLDLTSTSVPGQLATGFRPYMTAAIWIIFALYCFSRVKSLFGSDDEE